MSGKDTLITSLEQVQQWFENEDFNNLEYVLQGKYSVDNKTYDLLDDQMVIWTNHPNTKCGFICEYIPEKEFLIMTRIYDGEVFGLTHIVLNEIELESFVRRAARDYIMVYK